MTVDWSKQQRLLDVSDDEDDNNRVQVWEKEISFFFHCLRHTEKKKYIVVYAIAYQPYSHRF